MMLMCAPPRQPGPGRPSHYPWDLWTDGRVHSVHESMYSTRLQCVRTALTQHAKTRQLRLRTQLRAGCLRFQFLPQGSSRDFDLVSMRGKGPRTTSLAESRRGVIERLCAGELTPDEARQALGGVSRQRLYQVVKRLGMSEQLAQGRYSPLLSLSPRDIELYQTGAASLDALAAKTGMSASGMRHLLLQAGVRREGRLPYRGANGPGPAFELSQEEVHDYLADRLTVEGLAERKGCSVATVNNMLLRQGVSKHKRRRHDCFRLSRRECRALRQRQVTMTEVARRHDTTIQTVRKAMLRQGVRVDAPLEELP